MGPESQKIELKETKTSYIFAKIHFGGYHNILKNLKCILAAHLFYKFSALEAFLHYLFPTNVAPASSCTTSLGCDVSIFAAS